MSKVKLNAALAPTLVGLADPRGGRKAVPSRQASVDTRAHAAHEQVQERAQMWVENTSRPGGSDARAQRTSGDRAVEVECKKIISAVDEWTGKPCGRAGEAPEPRGVLRGCREWAVAAGREELWPPVAEQAGSVQAGGQSSTEDDKAKSVILNVLEATFLNKNKPVKLILIKPFI